MVSSWVWCGVFSVRFPNQIKQANKFAATQSKTRPSTCSGQALRGFCVRSPRRWTSLCVGAVLTAAVFITACATPTPIPEEKVRVGVTASTLMFAKTITDRSLTRSTRFEIVVESSSSALLAEAAQEKIGVGITLYLPENSILWATPLGEESIAVIVHPSNTLSNITLAQLQDIYGGRSNEWSAASREEGDDSRIIFDSKALRGVKPALTTALAPSPEAMIKFVSANQKGVGYVPLSWVNNTVKTISLDGTPPTTNNYPLRALIVAVAKQEPSGRTREWLGDVQSKK